MTVFTTIVNPADLRDTRFKKPTSLSPSIQYQIPPTPYFTLFHIQQYIADLASLPNKTHANSSISLSISNNSLSSYKNSRILKQHIDILWINSKIERIDLDFVQYKFREGILQRVLALINHVQKHSEYNAFCSITIPVDKDFQLSDDYITLLARFQEEFVYFSMINILIPKEFKRKHMSWFETVKLTHKNVSKQLKAYDSLNELFIGSIEKYLGFTFDCDVVPDHSQVDLNNLGKYSSDVVTSTAPTIHMRTHHSFLKHSVKTTVRQNIIHGEKKNMHEVDLLKIWKWANEVDIGQIQVRSYLTNSKNIIKILDKNKAIFNNDNSLMLPKEMLFKLADEVGIKNTVTSNYDDICENIMFPSLRSKSTSSSSTENTLSTSNTVPSLNSSVDIAPLTIVPDTDKADKGLPDYDTAMFEKMVEYEHEMNILIKLPSYKPNM